MLLHFNRTDIGKSGDQSQLMFTGLCFIRQTECYVAGHDMLDADATENPVRIRVIFCTHKKRLIIFVNLMFNLQSAQTLHFLGT